MPHDRRSKYLCVNTDEGEPGTFKDRELVEKDPHQVIEGAIIAAYAVGAQRAFVYIRGEFFLGVKRWIKAIADAYRAGLSGAKHPRQRLSLDMTVHRGAGAYICGEETAMIESLEGKPRRAAPQAALPGPARAVRPAHAGAQRRDAGQRAAHHLRGPAWYAGIGTPRAPAPSSSASAGTSIGRASTSCRWARRCARSSTSTPAACPGRQEIKAVIPGGASTPVLTRRPARYADGLSSRWPRPARRWAPAPSSSWTRRPAWSMWPGGTRAFSRTSPAGAACLAGWLAAAVGCAGAHRIGPGTGRTRDARRLVGGSQEHLLPDGGRAGFRRRGIEPFRAEYEDHVAHGHCR